MGRLRDLTRKAESDIMNSSMKDNMKSSLSAQRVTVSLPGYIYEKLIKYVPERQVSRFVASVLEEKLLSSCIKSADPIDEFLKLRKKVPKFSFKEIKEAINKGRE